MKPEIYNRNSRMNAPSSLEFNYFDHRLSASTQVLGRQLTDITNQPMPRAFPPVSTPTNIRWKTRQPGTPTPKARYTRVPCDRPRKCGMYRSRSQLILEPLLKMKIEKIRSPPRSIVNKTWQKAVGYFQSFVPDALKSSSGQPPVKSDKIGTL